MRTQTTKTMMKCTFSNEAHRILQDKNLTDKEKLDQIKQLDLQTSFAIWKINHRKYINRQRRKRQAEKMANGTYKQKNKTTKQQWEIIKRERLQEA